MLLAKQRLSLYDMNQNIKFVFLYGSPVSF